MTKHNIVIVLGLCLLCWMMKKSNLELKILLFKKCGNVSVYFANTAMTDLYITHIEGEGKSVCLSYWKTAIYKYFTLVYNYLQVL